MRPSGDAGDGLRLCRGAGQLGVLLLRALARAARVAVLIDLLAHDLAHRFAVQGRCPLRGRRGLRTGRFRMFSEWGTSRRLDGELLVLQRSM